MILIRYTVFLLTTLTVMGLMVLQGCAYRSVPVTSAPAPVAELPPAPPPVVPPLEPVISRPVPEGPSLTPRVGSRPVATLLAKAESNMNAGQLDHSAANLERALRISPRNPVLWQRLAEVRLRQGDPHQAEAMAIKSNSLPGSDSRLARNNWRIIAHARRLQGDTQGAREAERLAR
ncbi:MAG: tetratricopeptide repeat protein [Gammaproteobacteria bacterium]|nr:tetratricopeptide repeat protein [Gammaproteobacteria bacterium]